MLVWVGSAAAQQPQQTAQPHHNFTMSLQEVIETAHSQSPSAILARHNFIVNYWQFRTYKAQFLPSLNLQGSLLALSSGIAYAIYVVSLSTYKYEKGSVFGFSLCVSSIASVLLLLICLFTGQLALPQSPLGWLLSVGFACIVNAGAVALFQRGTFLIGGSRASILSTFEPITGVFVGILVFRETVDPFTLMGTALVITAGILIALFDVKKAKQG